jgi:hypothetical protein
VLATVLYLICFDNGDEMKVSMFWGDHEREGEMRIKSFRRRPRSSSDTPRGRLLRPLEVILDGQSTSTHGAAEIHVRLSVNPDEVILMFAEALRTSNTTPALKRIIRAALKESDLY